MQLPDISSKIPSNAEVITHPNSCYDWGTIGWLLESGRVDTSKYKYFLFMNSSVRGPFIPTFSQVPSLLVLHHLSTARLTLPCGLKLCV